MKHNDNIEKMISDKADTVKIPNKLEPDSICVMLKNQSAAKSQPKAAPKRRIALRFAAGATAFAVIAVGGIFAAKNANLFDSSSLKGDDTSKSDNKSPQQSDVSSVDIKEDSAKESYTEIYKTLEIAKNKVYHDTSEGFSFIDGLIGSDRKNETIEITEDIIYTDTDDGFDLGADENLSDDLTGLGGGDDYSETITQVEGIDEADIVKTNGSEIFYIVDNAVYSIPVENGVFGKAQIIFGKNESENEYINDMYLSDDKLVIITQTYEFSLGNDDDTSLIDVARNDAYTTNVYFVTESGSAECSYAQDGSYIDSRMIDSTLLLITNDNSKSLGSIDRRNRPTYLPSYYCDGSEEYVPAEDIVVSEDITELSYCIAASIDINAPESPKAIKAFAGSSGDVYCSADNLYIASYCYNYEESCAYTRFSRLSLADNLEIAAQSTIKGSVLNKYSMDEYDGFFRVALCYNAYNDDMTLGTVSVVSVLDMSLNEVGRCDGLGVGETIRSVRFSKETAYVVTFMQTDPLYAIDLSDPTNPVMLDEFKVSGYSTYLHPYKDNLMFSFGVEADEVTGQTSGLKMMMYDTSDPDNLVLLDSYVWENVEEYFDGVDENGNYTWYDNYVWYDSIATSEEKALFIDEERNIIGIPILRYDYYQDENNYSDSTVSGYYLFTFTDGAFSQIFVSTHANDNGTFYSSNFSRAVRIGEYLYALSPNKLISISFEDMSLVDVLEGYAE